VTFSFDLSLTLGNVLTLLGMAFAAGGIFYRVGSIEKKLDEFITKDVVDAKVNGIHREINGVSRRMDAMEGSH
jgi:hypothetical protein